MDPGEHAFYAGGRDGKIYIVALNGEHNPDSSHGLFIIGSLTDHRFLIFFSILIVLYMLGLTFYGILSFMLPICFNLSMCS